MIFTNFSGKVAHGPSKKPLDLGGGVIRARVGLRARLRLGGCYAVLCMGRCDTLLSVRFMVTAFATSAALADVCALLSVILVS